MERKVCLRNNSGLTLIEVLVILATICILAMLLLPSLTDGHCEPPIRIKCLGNIKQVDLMLIEYGMDNNDRLPGVPVGQGHWAWDMPATLTYMMARQGVTRDILYDPGFPAQNDDRLWNASPGKYHVIGYALALGGPGSTVIASNQNSTINPEGIVPGDKTSPRLNPASRVLVADAVITPGGQNNTNEMASYNWSKVRSSFPITHQSSHLNKNGKLPTGGNEGMMDGSGRWVKWQGMIPRTSGPADVATFWW